MAARGTLASGARLLAAAGCAVREEGGVLEVSQDGCAHPPWPGRARVRLRSGADVPAPGERSLRRGSESLDALVESCGPAFRRTGATLPRNAPDDAGHGLRAVRGATIETVGTREVCSTRWAVLYRREVRGPRREDALFSVFAVGDDTPRVERDAAAVLALLDLADRADAARGTVLPELPAGALAAADALAQSEAESFARARDAASLAALSDELRALGQHYAAAAEEESADEVRASIASEWHAQRDALPTSRRLRVRVTPLALVAVRIPERVFALRVHRANVSLEIASRLNLATGAAEAPACAACGGAAGDLAVCVAGVHAVCGGCARECAGCGLEFCAACGANACALGPEVSCARCRGRCDACGREACGSHRDRCDACRAEVCSECARRCPGCDAVHCQSHLRACSQCASPRCGSCLLSCASCGGRVCREDRADCAACGRVHCRACLAGCGRCGALLCPSDRDDARAHRCTGPSS